MPPTDALIKFILDIKLVLVLVIGAKVQRVELVVKLQALAYTTHVQGKK